MEPMQDIDDILNSWPFDPYDVNVRKLISAQRQVLQMRLDMGVLQLEVDGRPDGSEFQGATTYYDYLVRRAQQVNQFVLEESDFLEVDREFVQFYHRRVCWLHLKEFRNAVRDANHTLRLMDFCKQYSDDEEWTIAHEQYRPFVLYHRTQAAALAQLTEGEQQATVEQVSLAIEEVNDGLHQLHELFAEYDAEDQYDDDELVQRLIEFREGLRTRYEVGLTLKEQLDQAVAAEDYELAARLRDQIARRKTDADLR